MASENLPSSLANPPAGGENQLTDREGLAARLQRVRAEIAAAARAAGRPPDCVTLVGVSKYVPAELALQAVDLGLTDLGENRVQELLGKLAAASASGRQVRWHMIGTLQRNKVKYLISRTELIHSVDSMELLAEISRLSEAQGCVSNILLQVNTAAEVSKHGFSPDGLPQAAAAAGESRGVRLCGLMTMAPLFADPDEALPVFSRTRELFDSLALQVADPAAFAVLSMGMSQDFRQAIRCGATLVRIGTALFGSRM